MTKELVRANKNGAICDANGKIFSLHLQLAFT